jgi:hypothetical protein
MPCQTPKEELSFLVLLSPCVTMCHHCQGRSDCFALGSLTHLNQVFAQGTEETSGSHISTRIQANPNCEHLSTQAANILTSSISLALEPKSFSLNITHIEETLTRHDKTRSTTSQHEFFAALASLAGPHKLGPTVDGFTCRIARVSFSKWKIIL